MNNELRKENDFTEAQSSNITFKYVDFFFSSEVEKTMYSNVRSEDTRLRF